MNNTDLAHSLFTFLGYHHSIKRNCNRSIEKGNTAMNKLTPVKVTRRVIQIIAFVMLPGLFIETFSGIKSIVTSLMSGTFSFGSLSFQIFTVTAVLAVTIIAGRFFCGFLCAFGSMGDFAAFLGKKLHLPQPKVPDKLENVLKKFKYVFLLFIIVFIWILGVVSIPETSNPWTVFGMYAKIGSWPGMSYILSIGGALLIAIFVASMFLPRFFCRYLCPLGAVFSVVSKARIFNVAKPTQDCGGCSLCTKNCPMALNLTKKEAVRSGDCISCMECVDVCPRKNAHMKGVHNKYAATMIAVLCLCIMVGSYYGGNAYAKAYAESNASSTTSSSDSSSSSKTYDENSSTVADANDSNDTSAYKDGTYTGSGTGYRGTTTVKVVVKSGKITSITVVSYEDDQQWFERAADTVISEIKSSQNVDVDTVSGATFSSNSIRAAVADALSIDFTNPNDSASSEGPGGY